MANKKNACFFAKNRKPGAKKQKKTQTATDNQKPQFFSAKLIKLT